MLVSVPRGDSRRNATTWEHIINDPNLTEDDTVQAKAASTEGTANEESEMSEEMPRAPSSGLPGEPFLNEALRE